MPVEQARTVLETGLHRAPLIGTGDQPPADPDRSWAVPDLTVAVTRDQAEALARKEDDRLGEGVHRPSMSGPAGRRVDPDRPQRTVHRGFPVP